MAIGSNLNVSMPRTSLAPEVPPVGVGMAASLEGMSERLDPGEPVDKPLYDLTDDEAEARNVKRLPGNLLEAVEALDRDPLAREVLGPTMHELFVRYKRDEWHRFHEHVTDWEQAEYLQFY